MQPAGAKRFYERVETVPVMSGVDAFGVELDGRTVRTPAGKPLCMPSQELADAVRDEWRAQTDTIVPDSMPLMQLACTAVDRVEPNREAIIEQTVAFGAADLLCYFSDGPAELVRRQLEGWWPLLEWAAEALSAPLETTSGIVHVVQPESSLAALKGALNDLDNWQLTAAAQLTQLLGSLVLALAVCRERLEPSAAFSLAMLDEHFQAERWGEDREAAQRWRGLKREVGSASAFWRLLPR